MIKTASRLDGISEYYFAGKLREIAQMQREGKPIINLGIGSPDLPPAPEVVEALKIAADQPKSHGYQSYTGLPLLRRAWADWYARFYGVALDSEQEILPLIGSKEGILHIAMTFLEAGDVALVPNPGYPTYRAACLLAGASVQTYDLRAENNWQPDLAALEKTDLSRVKIIWVNFPHMPTGTAAAPGLFQKLADFGRRHQILVVNDNPYSFILNSQPQSILAAEGALEVALELNSLSKSHNMAGWRMGMVAGRADFVREILRFKSNMDSGQFQPMQMAAMEALRLPDFWYRDLNEIYRVRQEQAFLLLKKLNCTFRPAQQGLFVWGEIPAECESGFALSDALLYEKNVFVTPGGIFGSAGERFVRISLCQPVEVLKEATARVSGL